MSKTASHHPKSFLDRLVNTFRGGGAVVFMDDEGDSSELGQLYEVLFQRFKGRIPLAKRSSAQLLQPSGGSQKEDLLLVSTADAVFLRSLAAIHLAQVVYCGSEIFEASAWVDGFWDPTQERVEKILQGLASLQETNPSAAEKNSSKILIRAKDTARALFLDRDDVIVKNVPYNREASHVVLLPGIVELIQRAHEKNFLVIVCSNQSGLGRGQISPEEYLLVHQEMLRQLAKQGAWIEDGYWASYIDGAATAEGSLYPQRRKPRPGMFLEVREKWKIDVAKSIMIGDSASDLMAAFAARVGRLYLHCLSKAETERDLLAGFGKTHADFKFQSIHSFEEVDLV